MKERERERERKKKDRGILKEKYEQRKRRK